MPKDKAHVSSDSELHWTLAASSQHHTVALRPADTHENLMRSRAKEQRLRDADLRRREEQVHEGGVAGVAATGVGSGYRFFRLLLASSLSEAAGSVSVFSLFVLSTNKRFKIRNASLFS